ncbi:MAG: amidohydrolase [Cytophagales bacterium]|nr:MAG: amidohydrolase [Cytophagales bacterium]
MNFKTENLRVTLVQTDLHWELPEANRSMLEEKIWQHYTETDVIVLPEMFTTGFTMNVKQLAEPMNLTTLKWLRQTSSQTNALIIGSYIVKEDNQYFNRLIAMHPEGHYQYYDKRHLFRMANENNTFSSGNERLIINYRGWNICPLICYDLRFPAWSRNSNIQYDLLLFSANWPETRINAWKILTQARAIENSCYVIGVNRIGLDNNQTSYSGNSCAIDFKGNVICDLEDKSILVTTTLEKLALEKYRESFPVHLDADNFTINKGERS